jgi:5-methylcytosine-specific restriction endonuclease McrA
MTTCKVCLEETTNPIFCSRSCAMTFNNKKRVKKIRNTCQECSKPIPKTSHTRNRFCSRKCSGVSLFKKTVETFLDGEIPKHPETIKKCIEYIKGTQCVICGNEGTHMNSPLTLQLDHIDGNSDNESLSNLRLLCPNCHSQTPTYKGGNKNNPKLDKRNVSLRRKYATNKMIAPTGVEPVIS